MSLHNVDEVVWVKLRLPIELDIRGQVADEVRDHVWRQVERPVGLWWGDWVSLQVEACVEGRLS